MSSLAGEQALRDGVSFDFTWTAMHLIEVLEERAEAIMIGGLPGEKGVDFRLYYEDREEHHQVKRAYGTEGQWTLSSLDSEKILSDFRQRLEDPNVHCYLASGIPAVQLGYLADRARRCEDYSTFDSSYLTSEYPEWFTGLEKRWGLTRQECWDRLKRVYTLPFSEEVQTRAGQTMLRSLVVGREVDAWAQLREFCFGHVNRRVTASEIWQWLKEKGFERQIFEGDSRVVGRLNIQTGRYLAGIREKLIKPPLPRQVSASILCSLEESIRGEDIVVLGPPGGGKSAVMLQIAEGAIAKGWPVLGFRLDDLPATMTGRQLQEALDLPVSPAASVARASAGKAALVIVDQLDAVSEYSGRTGNLFDRIAEFVEELRAHRLRHPIHLVLACREVDWRYDGRLRRLHRLDLEKDDGVFKVEDLTDDEIRGLLNSAGIDIAMFSSRQREQLLRRPQYLALFIETRPDVESLKDIVTPKRLFDAYWDKKSRSFAKELPSLAGNQWFDILSFITRKLAETALALAPAPTARVGEDAPLAVSRSSLDPFSSIAIGWMLSNGVLSEGNGRIRFGHESFFDYCFARFFEQRGQSVLEYLLASDQTLIQRGQLRQILAYQRDKSISVYLNSIRDVLDHGKVRPHLKVLAAAVLCEAPDPSDAEWQFIEPRIRGALAEIDAGITGSVSYFVLNAFSQSLVLFQISSGKGVFADWLEKSGRCGIQALFRIIGRHQERAQSDVWELLRPLIGKERYETILENLSHFCHAAESRETFEWVVGRMKENYANESKRGLRWDRYHSLTDDLCKKRPEWFAEWLAAVIRARAKSEAKNGHELLRPEDVRSDEVFKAAEQAPIAFVEEVLPALDVAIEKGAIYYFYVWSDYGNGAIGKRSYISPEEAVIESVLRSIHWVLDSDPELGKKTLERLRIGESEAHQELYAAALCHEGEICASMAAAFLETGSDALSISPRGKWLGSEMFKVHANRWSNTQLSAIEKAILNCWPEHQNEGRKSHGCVAKAPCLGNYRGYLQLVLLRRFPSDKLSNLGARRLAELERKFASYPELNKTARKETPLNANAVLGWVPEKFLKAINARQSRKQVSWRRFGDGDEKIEPLLKEAVKRRPADFVYFLNRCDSSVSEAFIDGIDEGLMNLEIDSELSLEAAKQFYRIGRKWRSRSVSFLRRVRPGNCFREAFDLTLLIAKHGEGVPSWNPPKDGERGRRLHELAVNSDRGRAIGVLRGMIWADPELINVIRPDLEQFMKDSCPAMRTEVASLCYAIAFREENRELAMDLFLRLVTIDLPDQHVLSSHWPTEFIRVGLKSEWKRFQPVLAEMMVSDSPEIRATAARLVCIAVVSGLEAIPLAERCLCSEDPNVRLACAEVLSRNMGGFSDDSWVIENVLSLANDSYADVCSAVAIGQRNANRLDFSQLSGFLFRYSKTHAFLRGTGWFIESIVESQSVLPEVVFDLIESFIDRMTEPLEEGADHPNWYLREVSSVLTRLYHENRDGVLRTRALNLIDRLCVSGGVYHESLDQ